MSATNRGTIRNADDFYSTPAWCTRAIAPHLPSDGLFLDPCCGDGAILDVLAASGRRVVGIELDEGRADTARQKRHLVTTRDALDARSWLPETIGPLEWIVTNPPYTLAMEFVQRAHTEIARAGGSGIAMLLRLPWLASQKRSRWLQANTPSVFVLPRRPSFTGKGTDATDYAWLVWRSSAPTVRILECE